MCVSVSSSLVFFVSVYGFVPSVYFGFGCCVWFMLWCLVYVVAFIQCYHFTGLHLILPLPSSFLHSVSSSLADVISCNVLYGDV